MPVEQGWFGRQAQNKIARGQFAAHCAKRFACKPSNQIPVDRSFQKAFGDDETQTGSNGFVHCPDSVM